MTRLLDPSNKFIQDFFYVENKNLKKFHCIFMYFLYMNKFVDKSSKKNIYDKTMYHLTVRGIIIDIGSIIEFMLYSLCLYIKKDKKHKLNKDVIDNVFTVNERNNISIGGRKNLFEIEGKSIYLSYDKKIARKTVQFNSTIQWYLKHIPNLKGDLLKEYKAALMDIQSWRNGIHIQKKENLALFANTRLYKSIFVLATTQKIIQEYLK